MQYPRQIRVIILYENKNNLSHHNARNGLRASSPCTDVYLARTRQRQRQQPH